MADTPSNLQNEAQNSGGTWVEDQATGRKVYYPNINTGRETDRRLSTAFKIGIFLLLVLVGVWLFLSVWDANDGNTGYAAGIVMGVVLISIFRRKLIGWLSSL